MGGRARDTPFLNLITAPGGAQYAHTPEPMLNLWLASRQILTLSTSRVRGQLPEHRPAGLGHAARRAAGPVRSGVSTSRRSAPTGSPAARRTSASCRRRVLPRLGLEIIPGAGIACRGAVRSILLVSKVPPAQIRTLAPDTSSRTSVQLARIVLARPLRRDTAMSSRMPPDLASHARGGRRRADHRRPGAARRSAEGAAHVRSIWAQEWRHLTGLPMVFAVWAGRPGVRHARISPRRSSIPPASVWAPRGDRPARVDKQRVSPGTRARVPHPQRRHRTGRAAITRGCGGFWSWPEGCNDTPGSARSVSQATT